MKKRSFMIEVVNSSCASNKSLLRDLKSRVVSNYVKVRLYKPKTTIIDGINYAVLFDDKIATSIDCSCFSGNPQENLRGPKCNVLYGRCKRYKIVAEELKDNREK